MAHFDWPKGCDNSVFKHPAAEIRVQLDEITQQALLTVGDDGYVSLTLHDLVHLCLLAPRILHHIQQQPTLRARILDQMRDRGFDFPPLN